MDTAKLINVAVVGAFNIQQLQAKSLVFDDVKTFNNPLQASHEDLVELKNSPGIGAVVCFDGMYPNSLTRDGIAYWQVNFDVKLLEVGNYGLVIDFSGGEFLRGRCGNQVDVQQQHVYVAKGCMYKDGFDVEQILKYLQVGCNSHITNLADVKTYAAEILKVDGKCSEVIEVIEPVMERLQLTKNLYLPTDEKPRALVIGYLELVAEVSISAQLLLQSITTNKWYDKSMVEHRTLIAKEVFGL